jgi:diacylglycerol kinase
MKKWFNSAGHAIRGIALLFRTERNARIELVFALFALLLGAWLKIPLSEFCIIMVCIGAVLAAEAINSAVERMADFQSRENHPDIKSIKDIAAGAVLIMAVVSVVAGVLIFVPRILEVIGV